MVLAAAHASASDDAPESSNRRAEKCHRYPGAAAGEARLWARTGLLRDALTTSVHWPRHVPNRVDAWRDGCEFVRVAVARWLDRGAAGLMGARLRAPVKRLE